MTAGLDPAGQAVPTAAERGTTMLALPHVRKLTDGQRDGNACPWCDKPLTAVQGIDLGVRPGPFNLTIHPRGCRACVNAAARRAFAVHCRTCMHCTTSRRCDTRQVLRRLALEARS